MKRINFKVNESEYELLENLLEEKGGTLSSVMRGLIKDSKDHKEILERLGEIVNHLKNEKALANNLQIFINSGYCRIALEQLVKTTNQGSAINTNFEEFKRREGIK